MQSRGSTSLSVAWSLDDTTRFAATVTPSCEDFDLGFDVSAYTETPFSLSSLPRSSGQERRDHEEEEDSLVGIGRFLRSLGCRLPWH